MRRPPRLFKISTPDTCKHDWHMYRETIRRYRTEWTVTHDYGFYFTLQACSKCQHKQYLTMNRIPLNETRTKVPSTVVGTT